MTTSNYMLDVEVHIAFDSGYATPAASRTWTDVSAYVELADGVGIQYGRSDERSVADANSLTLTLDNRDGRFTPGNSGSPYYPNVKLGRPIRVRATPVGGSASVRFVGYIDRWAVGWDGTDAYSFVQVQASSRIARLGLSTGLRSVVEQAVLADGPLAYYTMGEAEGATAASDSSGNGAPMLVRSGPGVVFGGGTGPGTDDLSAATFAGVVGTGDFLSGAWESGSPVDLSVSAWFTMTGTGTLHLLRLYSTASPSPTAAAHYRLRVVSGSGISGGFDVIPDPDGFVAGSYDDGLLHHVVATFDDSTDTVSLYVDGVLVDTATNPGTSLDPLTEVRIGGLDLASGTGSGVVAHASIHDTVLDATAVAAMYAAGLDGFEGDLTGDRFERYAAYGNVPTAEVDADAGSVPMTHVDSAGQSVLDMLRVCETTEGGVMFDGRDGTLTLRDRADRYHAAAAITLAVANQEVESDYQPDLDRSALLNEVTAALSDGTVSSTVVDTASRDEYGTHNTSVELATTDADEPLQRASWLVGQYATPEARVPTLGVDLLPFDVADQAAILGLGVGSRLDVSGLPSQAASGTAQYFVEGYTETIGPESYTFVFNVSPPGLTLGVWILEDATYGVLGETTRLAY